MTTGRRSAVIALAVAAAITAGGVAAAVAAPGATRAMHVRRLTDKALVVTVSIPAGWTKIAHLGPGRFGYTGTSGWMQLMANGDPGGLRHTCRLVSAGTASIAVFGKHPRITFRTIDGRPGCVIMPSADSPRWAWRRDGPKFQQAEALIVYRHPIHDDGRWPLLSIFSDPAHIKAIVRSVHLHR
jgi:hypothetical protein